MKTTANGLATTMKRNAENDYMTHSHEIFDKALSEFDETGIPEDVRKNIGAYYTSREIVNFMCTDALKQYLYSFLQKDSLHGIESIFDCDNRAVLDIEPSVEHKTDAKLIDALKSVTVLDPSCGAGAFLMGMMQLLFDIRKKLEPDADPIAIKRSIAARNIFGCDIDQNAVNISKLRMKLFLAGESEAEIGGEIAGKFEGATAEDTFLLNIRCANSLTIDIKKLFDINDAAAEKSPLNDGNDGFDIVIGNPPYIGEKGHREIFEKVRNTPLGKRFYHRRMDLFYFFFHLGIDILKKGGILSYISTNYYPTADGAILLRKDLRERTQILKMIDFNELTLFESAKGQHNLITTLLKTGGRNPDEIADETTGESGINSTDKSIHKTTDETIIITAKEKGVLTGSELHAFLAGISSKATVRSVNRGALFDGNDAYIRQGGGDPAADAILEKIASSSYTLGEIANINQGIVTGADKFTAAHAKKYPNVSAAKGEGIFVYPEGVLTEMSGTPGLVKPWYKTSDIGRYHTSSHPKYELLLSNFIANEAQEPCIIKNLKRFRPILENRSQPEHMLDWWDLHQARMRNKDKTGEIKHLIFDGPKIVSPQRSQQNTFAYSDTPWYASADVYFITEKEQNRSIPDENPLPQISTPQDFKALLALLNSKLIYFWLYHRGKRKGELLELYATPLKQIPINLGDSEDRAELAKLADSIMNYKGNLSALERSESTQNESLDLESKNQIAENQIDEIVCRIYGLTDAETAHIIHMSA